jgi:hypothetical protein
MGLLVPQLPTAFSVQVKGFDGVSPIYKRSSRSLSLLSSKISNNDDLSEEQSSFGVWSTVSLQETVLCDKEDRFGLTTLTIQRVKDQINNVTAALFL